MPDPEPRITNGELIELAIRKFHENQAVQPISVGKDSPLHTSQGAMWAIIVFCILTTVFIVNQKNSMDRRDDGQDARITLVTNRNDESVTKEALKSLASKNVFRAFIEMLKEENPNLNIPSYEKIQQRARNYDE